jgi:ankyrin repeat protein
MDNTTQDYLGMTVAHYTAYSKSSTPEDMAFCVKDNKNAFATRDIDGRTLLHLALQRGNIALIRYILNNPRAKDALLLSDWEGQMPLHFAIASPRTRAIDLVLDAGCDIHATDLRGRTALHRAASEGNSLAVQKLLEKGAMSDLQRRDLEGKTPLMAARWKDRKEVEEYLRPLCGGSDEDGDEVDGGPWDNLEIHEGLKSHAFWEYWMLQKRLFILLIGFGVLLIYMVRYADWHKNSRVVDS